MLEISNIILGVTAMQASAAAWETCDVSCTYNAWAGRLQLPYDPKHTNWDQCSNAEIGVGDPSQELGLVLAISTRSILTRPDI